MAGHYSLPEHPLAHPPAFDNNRSERGEWQGTWRLVVHYTWGRSILSAPVNLLSGRGVRPIGPGEKPSTVWVGEVGQVTMPCPGGGGVTPGDCPSKRGLVIDTILLGYSHNYYFVVSVLLLLICH